jgi:hypothetical protein
MIKKKFPIDTYVVRIKTTITSKRDELGVALIISK